VTDDRQPETQTALASRRGRIALAEPIEDMWKEPGIDASARVSQFDVDLASNGANPRTVIVVAKPRNHRATHSEPDVGF